MFKRNMLLGFVSLVVLIVCFLPSQALAQEFYVVTVDVWDEGEQAYVPCANVQIAFKMDGIWVGSNDTDGQGVAFIEVEEQPLVNWTAVLDSHADPDDPDTWSQTQAPGNNLISWDIGSFDP